MMWMRQTVFFKVVYWGAAGWQQMTSLGWCRIQTSYAVSQYCLGLAGPRGCFCTTVSNWQAPRVIFLQERVWSLAAEGGQTQELKTCL